MQFLLPHSISSLRVKQRSPLSEKFWGGNSNFFLPICSSYLLTTFRKLSLQSCALPIPWVSLWDLSFFRLSPFSSYPQEKPTLMPSPSRETADETIIPTQKIWLQNVHFLISPKWIAELNFSNKYLDYHHTCLHVSKLASLRTTELYLGKLKLLYTFHMKYK